MFYFESIQHRYSAFFIFVFKREEKGRRKIKREKKKWKQ